MFATDAYLLLFDVDHFKAINDKFGHQACDAVLTTIAQTCAKNVRTTDILCRFGALYISKKLGRNRERLYSEGRGLRIVRGAR